MPLINPIYKELQEKLVKIRREKNLFTIQDVASECNVSEMTVRNFEKLKCSNTEVFLYYLFHANEKTPI